MAAKEPRAMDAIETNTTICCHCSSTPGKATMVGRTNIAMPAIFGAAAKNAVTGVGAPSYTSGVHIWNGTAETLKQKPANKNTIPKERRRLGSRAPLAMPEIDKVRGKT